MTENAQPFNDLLTVLEQLPSSNIESANAYLVDVENPISPLSDEMAGLVAWLGAWQDNGGMPRTKDTHICVLASSYKGLSDPTSVKKLITDASQGRAAINSLCVKEGIGLRVLELAPEIPHDLSDSWPAADCMAALAFGMEATAAGGDLLGLYDLAPGNKPVAEGLIRALLSQDAPIENTDDALGTLELLRQKGGERDRSYHRGNDCSQKQKVACHYTRVGCARCLCRSSGTGHRLCKTCARSSI